MNIGARFFAVGIEKVVLDFWNLLERVEKDGGAARVLRGAYGQGKTFALRVLQEMALEAGFLVARTEIDATENQLNKPHHIYRDLMANLHIPRENGRGAAVLARLAANRTCGWDRSRLRQELQCEPLAWLFSDPGLPDKPLLMGLLSCEPGIPLSLARKAHRNPGQPSDWPAFSAGTQGDFACYILSGIGRLARLMGYKGFILILDEMEKWQDLNWKAQSQAGNLLGGLIWGATAEEGERSLQQKPWRLYHSGRCGGYPFTTEQRCHLGVAIAMTPRGDRGPEWEWAAYGPLLELDLPPVTPMTLATYVVKLAPLYALAYNFSDSAIPPILNIAQEATKSWQQQADRSMRTAVTAVVQALDNWRDNVKVHAAANPS